MLHWRPQARGQKENVDFVSIRKGHGEDASLLERDFVDDEGHDRALVLREVLVRLVVLKELVVSEAVLLDLVLPLDFIGEDDGALVGELDRPVLAVCSSLEAQVELAALCGGDRRDGSVVGRNGDGEGGPAAGGDVLVRLDDVDDERVKAGSIFEATLIGRCDLEVRIGANIEDHGGVQVDVDLLVDGLPVLGVGPDTIDRRAQIMCHGVEGGDG